jgi:hypothetical protein
MKQIDYINDNLEKPIGLIAGYAFLFTTVFVALKTLFPDTSKILDLIIYVVILTAWTIFWMIIRNRYPRNKKGYIGIIISITTENDKQKLRLRNDFIKRLDQQIKSNNIDILINLIYIPDNKTSKINKVLDEFSTT